MNRKYYITSNGCAVLMHETERISKYFRLNGWEETDEPHEAEIGLITCCGVTQNEENQALDMISSLNDSLSDNATLIVSGCLPGFAAEQIMDTAERARLLTYQQLDNLDDIICASIPFRKVHFNIKAFSSKEGHREDDDERLAIAIDRWKGGSACLRQYEFCTMRKYKWQSDDVYQIKVSYGCPGKCTYCATKLGIGNFRSVNPQEVISQFKEGLEKGYRRYLLIGDEIGTYGREFGETIVTLLEKMYSLDNTVTVSIRYIHPDILVRHYEALRKFFAEGFVDYFCSAIQSASPAILKAMGRNPNLEPFIKCMEDLNANHYPVNIHTQIIIGFPGESSDDFLLTLSALNRCNFDHININLYSPRKGTPAYSLGDTVPQEVKLFRKDIIKHNLDYSKMVKMYNAIKSTVIKND